MTTSSRFRFQGVTDDVIQCQRCGKDELRKTIVLVTLDADGNDDEAVYYGSSCAARVLSATGRKTTGAQVRRDAEIAMDHLRRQAEDAQRSLDYWTPFEAQGEDALAAEYARVHATAMWADRMTPAAWLDMARDTLARRRAQVAAYARVLHPAA